MKNIIYLIITIFIWLLSITFMYIHNRGSMNVSPWGMHNFINIIIQIGVIFLPIIGLYLSIQIRRKVTKIVMIIGSLVNIYYLSIPFSLVWFAYFNE